MISKFVKNALPKNCVPTIGVEFAAKTIVIPSGIKIKVQIWDTSGQERYRTITLA